MRITSSVIRIACLVVVLLVSYVLPSRAQGYDLDLRMPEELLTQYVNAVRASGTLGDLTWAIENPQITVNSNGARVAGYVRVLRKKQQPDEAAEHVLVQRSVKDLNRALQLVPQLADCDLAVPSKPSVTEFRKWLREKLGELNPKSPHSRGSKLDPKVSFADQLKAKKDKDVCSRAFDYLVSVWRSLRVRYTVEAFYATIDLPVMFVYQAGSLRMEVDDAIVEVVDEGGASLVSISVADYLNASIALSGMSANVGGSTVTPALSNISVSNFDGYVRIRGSVNL